MTPEHQSMGRLALRVEGDWWVAYYALVGTMEGALEIARIRMAPVEHSKDHKQAFMELMKAIVADYLKGITGADVSWPEGPQRAPESERSGRS